MTQNSVLDKARLQKRDEFYTQLVDIENELRHYTAHFKDKVVYCNCDDPYESNFFRYFAANFNALGLKRLLATSYSGSSTAGKELPNDAIKGTGRNDKHPIVIDITDVGDDGGVGLIDAEWLLRNDANVSRYLEGDGDFRSVECVELLKQADIAVTNPPFSLFREYFAQLVEHDKQFLILGDQNAVAYKEVFARIRDGRVWLGHDNGGTKWFRVPMEYDIRTESRKKIVDGIKYFSMGRICWFTNLKHSKRQQELILYKKYTPEEFPAYDNYDAIEVSRVADIPVDHDGVMGVPITFLGRHNPEQFEIVDKDSYRIPGHAKYDRGYVDGKRLYGRLWIKRVK